MPRNPAILPFAATLVGVALFSLMDALMKGGSIAVGAYSALLVRSLLGMVLTVPAWALRRRWPARPALKLHLLRGFSGAAMAFTFFWGIARLPLAEAIALSFTAPLLALGLAAALLRERIGRNAWAAGLLGIAGVALIAGVRMEAPQAQSGWGIAAVLLSSLLYAWNLILQRQQALVAAPLEVAAFQNSIYSLALLPFAPWFLIWPAAGTLGTIGGAAVLAVAAAMILSWAYARAEAQALVPLEYSGFLWAALFGWLLFGETVVPTTLAGAVLIVAGCALAAPRKRTEQTAT
ncbi:DMT family transporter [Altericroceibacterium xinjiangense]|uniref:DMT family transporter n=1 Tax=Altericroceibacterium xinjiangense TaxID=762261 RepID=UPI000F7DF0F0|nr:DMT family transporter [Altericroceibacterium xinjiangense]